MRAPAARLGLLGLLVAVPATAMAAHPPVLKKSPEDVKAFLKNVFALTP